MTRMPVSAASTNSAPGRRNAPVAKDLPNARIASIDVVRFLAAIVIVLFHAKLPVGPAMTASLGFFTATVAFFAAGSLGTPRSPLLRRRVTRLLVPFAIWTGIMLAMKVADSLLTAEPLIPELARWLPPRGTLGQLWFLPFAFVVSELVAFLSARWHRRAAPPPMVTYVLALVLSGVWLWLLSGVDVPNGIRVLLNFLPSALLGALLSRFAPGVTAMTLAAGLAVAAGLAATLAGWPETEQLWIGVPVLALCRAFPGRRGAASDLLGAASLPVYLVHVALIAALMRLLPMPIGSTGFAAAAVATAVAVAFGYLALRHLGQPRAVTA